MPYSSRISSLKAVVLKGSPTLARSKFLMGKGILPNITRVGGTSAGAITALLLGLNYANAKIRGRIGEIFVYWE
jgi:NTE family protein